MRPGYAGQANGEEARERPRGQRSATAGEDPAGHIPIIVVLGFSLGPRVLDLLLLIAIGYGPVAVWRGPSWSPRCSWPPGAWPRCSSWPRDEPARARTSCPLLLPRRRGRRAQQAAHPYVPCGRPGSSPGAAPRAAGLVGGGQTAGDQLRHRLGAGLIVLGWRFGRPALTAETRDQRAGRAVPARRWPGVGPPAVPPPHPARSRTGPPAEPPGCQTAEGAMRPAEAAANWDRPPRTRSSRRSPWPRPWPSCRQDDRPAVGQSADPAVRSRRRAGANWLGTRPRSRCSIVFLGPPGTGKSSRPRSSTRSPAGHADGGGGPARRPGLASAPAPPLINTNEWATGALGRAPFIQ